VNRLRRALRDVAIGDGGIAMLELAITDGVRPTVVVCVAARACDPAACTERDDRGRVVRRFTDTLVDVPGWDAISVQRESAPITTPF